MSPTPEGSALIVVNMRARRARDVRVPVQTLREALDATVLWPSQPEEMDQPLAAAVAKEQPVVVVGGDGTADSVLQRLWQLGVLSQARLGLVPYGQCNAIARCFGIPLDPAAAARTILEGAVASFYVVSEEETGTVFVAAHLGPGAAGLRHIAQPRPVQWLRRVAVAVARPHAPELEVRVDDATVWSGRPHLVTVAAARSSSGSQAGEPPQSVEVVVVPGRSRRRRRRVVQASGTTVAILGEPTPVVVGGESSLLAPPLTYTAVPRGLHVFVSASR